jgi:hypothetical protein
VIFVLDGMGRAGSLEIWDEIWIGVLRFIGRDLQWV